MYLVTGGCGFLGKHLVRALAQRGDRVRVLDIRAPRTPESGVDYRQGSVSDAQVVDEAMQGVRFVFHMAGVAHLWHRDKSVYERVNHQGARCVFESAMQHGVEKVVHTSTASIFLAAGEAPQGNALPAFSKMLGSYTRSKWLAHEAALDYARRGLPLCVVSPAAPIGVGDEQNTPPTRMLKDFLMGKHPAYLDCYVHLVCVEDVTAGHLAAMRCGASGGNYLLSAQAMRLSALLEIMEKHTRVRVPKIKIPYGLALASAWVMQFVSDTWIHSEPAASVEALRLVRHAVQLDGLADMERLGLTPACVQTALIEVLTSLQQSL